MIADLRKSSRSPGSLGYDSFLSTRSSSASLVSNASSVRSTVNDDDDETRAIRRLLLRKIEATFCGALDEIDMVVGWLRIVKEVVRGVKRRAYL